MLRFSLEPGARRAAFSAAYTLLGVGLIPLSILAVHLAESLIHPTVITREGTQDGGSMLLTFVVSLAGMLALSAAMFQVELQGKLAATRLRRCSCAARDAPL